MAVVKYIGWCLLVIFCLVLSLSILEMTSLEYLVDMASVQVIVAPLCFFCWISYQKEASFNKLIMVLGIPLGLIGVMIGINGQAIVLITNEPSINSLGETAFASSVALLCAIYGGLISAVGYFLYNDKKIFGGEKISLSEAIILMLGVILFWVVPIVTGLGMADFVDWPALMILALFCTISVFGRNKNDKGICESITDAAIYSCVLGVVIGLATWYSSGLNPTVASIRFSCLIIMYSLMVYVLAYLFSYYTGETKNINFSIKNWHLVETSTFFIFLMFAPISISDYLYNEKENIEQRAIETELRKEIKNLSDRLAAIERVS